MARLTPFELEAILRAQGCTCYDEKRAKGWGCCKRIIRCAGRMQWMKNNDEKFRRVWGIDTPPEGVVCK